MRILKPKFDVRKISRFNYGTYRRTFIDEIPLDYLYWVFSKCQYIKRFKNSFINILRYFLTKDIRVEDKTKVFLGYWFYFVDEDKINPFMQSFYRTKNAKGNWIYEIGFQDNFIYLEEVDDDKFKIFTKFQTKYYPKENITIIFEKNENYYFYDTYNQLFKKCRLLKDPKIYGFFKNIQFTGEYTQLNRKKRLGKKFMKNLKIKN